MYDKRPQKHRKNIYIWILLSHNKEQNFAIYNIWVLSEVSQTEKTHTVWQHIYMESKKYNKVYKKMKQTHRYTEQTGGYQWQSWRDTGVGIGGTDYWI